MPFTLLGLVCDVARLHTNLYTSFIQTGNVFHGISHTIACTYMRPLVSMFVLRHHVPHAAAKVL